MKSFLLAPLLLATAAFADYNDDNDVVWVTSTVQITTTLHLDECCAYSGTTYYGAMPSASGVAWNGTGLTNATTAKAIPAPSAQPAPPSNSNNSTSSGDSDDSCSSPVALGGACSGDTCCAKGLSCDSTTNTCLIVADPVDGTCSVGPGVVGADCSQYTDCCGDNIICDRASGKCQCDDPSEPSCGNGNAAGGQPAGPTLASSAPASAQTISDGDGGSCVNTIGSDCSQTDCCHGLTCDSFAFTCLKDTDPDGNNSCLGPNTVGADCSQWTDCCPDANGNDLTCDHSVGTCSSDS